MGHKNFTWLPEDTNINPVDNAIRKRQREVFSRPSDVQIGGDHYKNMAIQPTEFITKNKLGFIEGCIVKYACRHRFKGGREDLEKIKHYVDLLLEYEYTEG